MKVAKQIYPLTSLRFFAALCVVFHHTLDAVIPVERRPGWANRLQTYSGAAVLLFFILSGYVLAVVYLAPEQPLDRRRFWKARVARIYPVYLAALVLDTPNLFYARLLKYGVASAVLKTTVSFLGSVLLLQSWIPMLRGIDFPNWSLSVEALFYFLFPLLAPLLWRMRLPSQLSIATAASILLFGLQYVGWRLKFDPFPYMLPVSFLPFFIAGLVLARGQIWLKEDVARLARWQRLAIPLAVACCAALLIACGADYHGPTFVVPGLVFLPVFTMLLLAFAIGSSTIEGIFANPFLVLLGESSYALYLLHVIIWTWLFHYARMPVNAATYVLYLFASVGVSIASFRCLEAPARQWLLRAFRQRSRESEAAASIAQ